MRRVSLANLILAALATCSSALAVETTTSTPSALQGKQAATPRSNKPAMPLSSALRETVRANELPAASARSPQPASTQPIWTGTYVGAGGGISK